jgi:hypothetical protein
LICFPYGYHYLMTWYTNWQINTGWFESIQYIIISMSIKESRLKYLFWVKLYFYWSFGLAESYRINFHTVLKKITRKILAMLRYFFMLKKHWSDLQHNADKIIKLTKKIKEKRILLCTSSHNTIHLNSVLFPFV